MGESLAAAVHAVGPLTVVMNRRGCVHSARSEAAVKSSVLKACTVWDVDELLGPGEGCHFQSGTHWGKGEIWVVL